MAEVDRALKGLADGMNGQWNFGDIRMPTPYDVRRMIASSLAQVRSRRGWAEP